MLLDFLWYVKMSTREYRNASMNGLVHSIVFITSINGIINYNIFSVFGNT